MFATYEDIHISNDQINQITNWLSNWDLGESKIANEATSAGSFVLESYLNQCNI
jgi:hypothetical protein